MLSAARRTVSACASSSGALVEQLHRLVVPLATPSRGQPLSTSAVLHAAPEQRLSKAKRAERLDKLERKRSLRSEITESLPPFSEDQLEAMYQGLLAAPASEFALPALEASKAPALPDPAVNAQRRQDRLARLALRLERLEAD
ncbi:hypothetical protein JCM3770_005227, partial [Rhodotorula araucariae]